MGQVSNPHRLTHIENKNLTPFSMSSCFKHKFTSFRNQHKESNDVRICNSYRTTCLYLLLKQRYNRSRRTQYIAEACSHKLSRSLSFHATIIIIVQNLFIQSLRINLTNSLRTSHYIGRIYSLICANHDEFLHTILHT